MSVLTIAIIAAVILYSLFYIDCDKQHGFLPDELGVAVFLGVIIDSIVLIICAAIRFGWWGFIISAIILVCLFFGIDEYAGKASPKEVQKFEEEWERENIKLSKSIDIPPLSR